MPQSAVPPFLTLNAKRKEHFVQLGEFSLSALGLLQIKRWTSPALPINFSTILSMSIPLVFPINLHS